jgi:hypothetical protein
MIKVNGLVDGSCPSIVNQKNWLGGSTHSDTFTVSNGACVRKAEFADGVYSLKGGRDGKFCASEGNKIVCDRDSVGEWEKFTMEKHNQWYGIKAHNGKYCADEQHAIVCDRSSVGGWERFNIDKIGDKFALRPDREHKYCADEPDGVKCTRDGAQGWELFDIERLPDPPPPSPPPSPSPPPPPDPNRACTRRVFVRRIDARRGWGMPLEFNCHGKTIHVGHRSHETKILTIHGIGRIENVCPHNVDKNNWNGHHGSWQGPWYHRYWAAHSDRFLITGGGCE